MHPIPMQGLDTPQNSYSSTLGPSSRTAHQSSSPTACTQSFSINKSERILVPSESCSRSSVTPGRSLLTPGNKEKMLKHWEFQIVLSDSTEKV